MNNIAAKFMTGIAIGLITLCAFSATTHAVTMYDLAGNVGTGINSGNAPAVDTGTNFAQQLGIFINYLLTILGLVMLLMLLYGGVVILFSLGNEESLGSARKIITYALMGIVIIALAYTINAWIFGSSFFA